jgi:hypothetical protein
VVLTYLRANDGNFRGGFGLVVALPVTAALLLPVALLLRRFERAHALAVTSAGALVGAAVGIPEGIGREGGGLRLWLRGQPQRPQPPLHGVGLGHGARL